MTIAQSVPASFRLELLQGIHNFAADTFKMALYDVATSNLGPATMTYTSSGEIAAAGYTPGGIALVRTVGWPQIFGSISAGCRFDDAVWTGVTFNADGAMIYNSSKANRAVLVLAFATRQSSISGSFSVRFPLSLDPIVNLK